MKHIKIGILKEGKIPADHRVALIPDHCRLLLERFPYVTIAIQPSADRCFLNYRYEENGCVLQNDLSDCDILLGVKEVPVDQLIPNKTYLFFSHTIKKQAHNQKLLRSILSQKITLIDYETITFDNGKRIVAFGHFAGIVGAHNGLLAWGKKTGDFDIKPAHEVDDYAELRSLYTALSLPPLRIAVTGNGRVGAGACELLDAADIKQVTPHEYLTQSFSHAVYCVLRSKDLYAAIDGSEWNAAHYHSNPEAYKSKFLKYAKHTDIMINTIYWDPKAPRFFTVSDMAKPNFEIKVIADISCDIDGSIPATKRATTIENPVMGFDPRTGEEVLPYLPDSIDIMAVDNLPCELPKDASHEFSHNMLTYVLPRLLQPHDDQILERATLVKQGKLTENYSYLSDYAGLTPIL